MDQGEVRRGVEQKGLTSLMPDEAYQNRDYHWDYQEAASG